MVDDPLDRLERRVEGLYVSYGALENTQTRHDERIDRGTADRTAIREEMRVEFAEIRNDMKEARQDMLAAIGRSEQRTIERINTVKASCDKGWHDMTVWVEQYERDEKAKRDRESDRAERSLMSRRQVTIGVIALVLTALGMIMTLMIVLLGGGA